MKKFLFLVLSLILAMSLMACASKAPEGQNSLNNQEVDLQDISLIEDYFPFKENTVMKYEGIGNEFAERESFVEYMGENKAQIKTINPGTVFVKVLENKDGVLTEVFSEGEFYHIENMLNANVNTNKIILKEPLVVGNSWKDEDGNEIRITSLNKEIETPSGVYEALEVTTEYENASRNKDYYAKDIGLVASIYEDGEFKVETLLEEIKNTGQNIEIETYYPTANDIASDYTNQSIEFNTNDNLEKILENLMKNPPNSNFVPVISSDTRINEIHLNRNQWILEIDFSKEMQEFVTTGSAYETEILQSLVNTLGKFYDTDKVYISIDGKPYESGHYMLKEGEFFKVSIDELE